MFYRDALRALDPLPSIFSEPSKMFHQDLLVGLICPLAAISVSVPVVCNGRETVELNDGWMGMALMVNSTGVQPAENATSILLQGAYCLPSISK
jgi:hypothetical protein